VRKERRMVSVLQTCLPGDHVCFSFLFFFFCSAPGDAVEFVTPDEFVARIVSEIPH
jgi:hypothetical protein